MADVKALDALWDGVQRKTVLKVLEAAVHAGLGAHARGQGVIRVAQGQVQPAPALAAHPRTDPHAVAGIAAQGLLQHLSILDVVADDQLLRRPAAKVVAGDEGVEHLAGIGGVRHPGEERAVAEVGAVADDEHLHAGDGLADAAGDDIHVALGAGDVLALLDRAQRGDAVAQPRRLLERQVLGGAFHAGDQLIDHAVAVPVQEHLHVAHVAGVVLLADVAHARRGAALDLVLQARPGAVLEEAVPALAHGEDLLQVVERFAHRAGAGERPEIPPLPLAATAVKAQPREALVGGEVDVGIALVVAQQDVVARAQLLDEVVLEDQRLGLGVGHRDLHVGDLRHHGLGLGVVRLAGEVARHPAL